MSNVYEITRIINPSKQKTLHWKQPSIVIEYKYTS